MRWDALSLDGQEPGLFGQPVTVDTPEFRGITCHEIRAKSIINKVPGASPTVISTSTPGATSTPRSW
jgi:hypothetical protein